MKYPSIMDPKLTFDALVAWLYEDILVQRKAPGLLVGLSGIDSVLTFLAAAKALSVAGAQERLMGVHFAPSDDFLDLHPEAKAHLWFAKEVISYLKEQAPEATIVVDTSIDWRCDGLRWGALADLSVVAPGPKRAMRAAEDQYWILGTRNRTEDELYTYSNASMLASVQPLTLLWKTEVLEICRHLAVPEILLSKSCEVDCICGRERLPAQHASEIDTLLQSYVGEVSKDYVSSCMSSKLQSQLMGYIQDKQKGIFKTQIPYTANACIFRPDPLVASFENGTLDLRQFNHSKHLYVAWRYLQRLPMEKAITRYAKHLTGLLHDANQMHRFNLDLTQGYFNKLSTAMTMKSTATFPEIEAALKALK